MLFFLWRYPQFEEVWAPAKNKHGNCDRGPVSNTFSSFPATRNFFISCPYAHIRFVGFERASDIWIFWWKFHDLTNLNMSIYRYRKNDLQSFFCAVTRLFNVGTYIKYSYNLQHSRKYSYARNLSYWLFFFLQKFCIGNLLPNVGERSFGKFLQYSFLDAVRDVRKKNDSFQRAFHSNFMS